MKQNQLQHQLEEEHDTLKRIRERIMELRHSIEFEEQGIEIIYAVDFSEVYGYLNITAEETDDRDFVLGVSLDSNHPEKSFFHYWLGLTHLFNSFGKTLYLLPPHTLEMWSYVRTQAQRTTARDEQYSELLDSTRNFDPWIRQLLESLWGLDTTLEPETSRQLLDFVKSPLFRPLCLDVSDFLNWYKRGNVLKNLFKSQKLSYRTDQLLAGHINSVSELKEPTQEETLELLRCFPPIRRRLRRSSTMIDCRALIFLRNINRILNRANAAMVLITKDTHILEAVKSIEGESWFGWSNARQHIRGIESIFFDLILNSTSSISDKSQWVLESDLKLASMQESVWRILLQMNRPPSVQSNTSLLASTGKKVLEDTSQLWEQHINVKLSLASKNLSWLGQGLSESFTEDNLPSSFKQYRHEYLLLKNLFEFLSTPEYQHLATQDLQDIFQDIEIDCLRMALLNLVDKEGAERISKILAETFSGAKGQSGTVLRSKRFLRMPVLQFVSKNYRERLKELSVRGKGKYNKAFLSIVAEAISRFNEPEDLLFIAFVLGMIDEWKIALTLIKKCRQIIADSDATSLSSLVVPSEVDYFAALIRRKIAEMEEDAVKAAEEYIKAYEDIRQAASSNPQEAKYVKDMAVTAMLYHEAIKKVCVWPVDKDANISIYPETNIPSEAEAKALYIKALNLIGDPNDIRLKVVILNNLAFAEVLSNTPNFQDAEEYLRQIDEILSAEHTGEENGFTLEGVRAHIEDTKIMVRARRAKELSNTELLNSCITDLNALLLGEDLPKGEKGTYSSHIELLKVWLQSIQESN